MGSTTNRKYCIALLTLLNFSRRSYVAGCNFTGEDVEKDLHLAAQRELLIAFSVQSLQA